MKDFDNSNVQRQHFNRVELLEKMGGNMEFFRQVLEMVQQGGIAKDVSSMHKFLENKINMEEVKKQAHKITGNANGSCFEILSDLAESLENLEPWDWEEAQKINLTIVKEMEVVEGIVSEILKD